MLKKCFPNTITKRSKYTSFNIKLRLIIIKKNTQFKITSCKIFSIVKHLIKREKEEVKFSKNCTTILKKDNFFN